MTELEIQYKQKEVHKLTRKIFYLRSISDSISAIAINKERIQSNHNSNGMAIIDEIIYNEQLLRELKQELKKELNLSKSHYLTPKEKFVIERKYIDGISWSQIERQYIAEFKPKSEYNTLRYIKRLAKKWREKNYK